MRHLITFAFVMVFSLGCLGSDSSESLTDIDAPELSALDLNIAGCGAICDGPAVFSSFDDTAGVGVCKCISSPILDTPAVASIVPQEVAAIGLDETALANLDLNIAGCGDICDGPAVFTRNNDGTGLTGVCQCFGSALRITEEAGAGSGILR